MEAEKIQIETIKKDFNSVMCCNPNKDVTYAEFLNTIITCKCPSEIYDLLDNYDSEDVDYLIEDLANLSGIKIELLHSMLYGNS